MNEKQIAHQILNINRKLKLLNDRVNYLKTSSSSSSSSFVSSSGGSGTISHGSLLGLNVDDHLKYVHTDIQRTITAQHTFNPSSAIAPFILGVNAQGNLVSGLNSQYLYGYSYSDFAFSSLNLTAGNGLTGGGDLSTDRTFNVGAGDGINVFADSIEVDVTDLLGNGLIEQATNNIAIGAGNGITVNANDIALTTPGTLNISSTNSSSGNHTHTITNSNNPGASATILASDSGGGLTLDHIDITNDIGLQNGSVINWGSDTNLYRGSSNRLQSDDHFRIDGSREFQIGSDVALSRYAPNVLKTEDSFRLGGNILFEDDNDNIRNVDDETRITLRHTTLTSLDNRTSDVIPFAQGLLLENDNVIGFAERSGDLNGWIDTQNNKFFFSGDVKIGEGAFSEDGRLTIFSSTAPHLRFGYDNTNYGDIQVDTGGNMEFLSEGNIVFYPDEKILPEGSIKIDAGAWNRKFKSFFAAELVVDTLVKRNILATIGGDIIVAPTTSLASNLNGNNAVISGDTAIWLRDSTPQQDDYLMLKKAPDGIAQFEILQIEPDLDPFSMLYLYGAFFVSESLIDGEYVATFRAYVSLNIGDTLTVDSVSGTLTMSLGDYEIIDIGYDGSYPTFETKKSDGSSFTGTLDDFIGFSDHNGDSFTAYLVDRDKDGTGENDWQTGDAVVSTGHNAGEGHIVLASTNTVYSQIGPSIVTYVRDSSTNWDDVVPTTVMGNLENFVDYSSYKSGFAVGKDLTQSPPDFEGITVDADVGVRMFNTNIKTYDGSTLTGEWTSEGDLKLGTNISADATTTFTFDSATGETRIGPISGSKANLYFDGTSLTMRSNTTNKIRLDGDGDFKVGTNISTVSGTLFQIFSNSQTYNSESVTSGDILFGDNSSGHANLFWDSSLGAIYLREGQTSKFLVNSSGNLRIGSNTDNAATTNLVIASGSYSWNGESLSAGDMLIGDNSSSHANILWDASAGQLNFRGGTTTQLYVSTAGALIAGDDRVILNSNGITFDIDTSSNIKTTLKWDYSGTRYVSMDAYRASLGGIHSFATWQVGQDLGGDSYIEGVLYLDVWGDGWNNRFEMNGLSGEINLLANSNIYINGNDTVSVLGTDVILGDNVYMWEYVYHYLDTDTHIRFLTDRIIITAGGKTMWDMTEGTNDFAYSNAKVISGTYASWIQGDYQGLFVTDASSKVFGLQASSYGYVGYLMSQCEGIDDADGTFMANNNSKFVGGQYNNSTYPGALTHSANGGVWRFYHSENIYDQGDSITGWEIQLELKRNFYIRSANNLVVGAEPAGTLGQTLSSYNNLQNGILVNKGSLTDVDIVVGAADNINHGMTTLTGTDVAFRLRFLSSGAGGAGIYTYSDYTDSRAFQLVNHTTNTNTLKSTAAQGVTTFWARRKSGTTYGSLASNQNIFVLRANNSGDKSVAIWDREGDYHYDGSQTAYDDEDDNSLLRTLSLVVSDNLNPLVEMQNVIFQKNKQILEDLGVVHFNEDTDGIPFISNKKLNALQTGAIWQNRLAITKIQDRILLLENKLERALSLIPENKLHLLGE